MVDWGDAVIPWHEYRGPNGRDWFEQATAKQTGFLHSVLFTIEAAAAFHAKIGEPIPTEAVCATITRACPWLLS